MTTTRASLLAVVLEMGDDPNTVECFYQNHAGELFSWDERDDPYPIVACNIYDLPSREFDAGYGGTNGEPCIAFSPRHVYIKSQYDGAERFVAIPRHPEHIGTGIPWPGG